MIPKRFRYYWDARPQNRNRKLLMEITLPKLPKRTVEPHEIQEQTENKVRISRKNSFTSRLSIVTMFKDLFVLCSRHFSLTVL